MSLYTDANSIIEKSIEDVLPDEACKKALQEIDLGQRVHIIAIGKAAWQMAHAAAISLGDQLIDGIVITKYHHSQGPIPKLEIYEAAHPTPDDKGIKATGRAIKLAEGLDEDDCLLFLVSGGGSSLFEDPMISLSDLQDINNQLLGCGASITEINTVRKHLSHVKGGRFAKIAQPARVYSIILNDIIGDYPSMIASGPTYPDTSTSAQALAILDKYSYRLKTTPSRPSKLKPLMILNVRIQSSVVAFLVFVNLLQNIVKSWATSLLFSRIALFARQKKQVASLALLQRLMLTLLKISALSQEERLSYT